MNIPEGKHRHIPLEIENLQLNKENGLPIGTEVEGGYEMPQEAELQCAGGFPFTESRDGFGHPKAICCIT